MLIVDQASSLIFKNNFEGYISRRQESIASNKGNTGSKIILFWFWFQLEGSVKEVHSICMMVADKFKRVIFFQG